MSRGLRNLSGVALTLFVLAVSGCDSNFFQDPIAVRADGTDLLVTVCTSIDAGKVLMEEVDPSRGGEWEAFWKVEQRVQLQKGTSATSADGFAGFGQAALITAPALRPGSELSIAFLPSSETSGNSTVALFTVPEAGIPSDGWLQAGGRITTAACPE